MTAVAMRNVELTAWWREAVVYHVYLPSFRDSDGDGYGDLGGLVERLPYLATRLGVDAIWISPFYVSAWRDGGYDVADHRAVDPRCGDLATFDRVIHEAHRRDVRVIVDYVAGHTSDRHPWFAAARGSRDAAEHDWYVWADEREPSDEGVGWEWDVLARRYYRYSHARELPDLNWHNPGLRAAMLDVLRFWLDRGVDGIRVDTARMVARDPGLEDVLGEIGRVLDSYGDRMVIGDGNGAQSPLDLACSTKVWHAERVTAALERAATSSWPVNVLSSHDGSRIATRVGEAQARVAALLLLTARGTPLLYYGDELGMTDIVPPVAGNGPSGGREHSRAPLPWDSGPHAGFTPADGERPWLPLPPSHRLGNSEGQLVDTRSLLSFYRRLIAIRRQQPALRRGELRLHDPGVEDCVLFERVADGERLLVALNLTGRPRTVALPGPGRAIVSTHLDRDRTDRPVGGALTLRADEGVLLELFESEWPSDPR